MGREDVVAKLDALDWPGATRMAAEGYASSTW